MEEILKQIQPFTTAVTSILSIGIFSLIFYIQQQLKDVYTQRIEAIKEQMDVISKRHEAAKDEIDRLEKINKSINTIGANLGIKSFQDEIRPGVQIRDVGSIKGEIAGRDINKMIRLEVQ